MKNDRFDSELPEGAAIVIALFVGTPIAIIALAALMVCL